MAPRPWRSMMRNRPAMTEPGARPAPQSASSPSGTVHAAGSPSSSEEELEESGRVSKGLGSDPQLTQRAAENGSSVEHRGQAGTVVHGNAWPDAEAVEIAPADAYPRHRSHAFPEPGATKRKEGRGAALFSLHRTQAPGNGAGLAAGVRSPFLFALAKRL